jgi:hypothetical protein
MYMMPEGFWFLTMIAVCEMSANALLLGRWQRAATALRLDEVAARGVQVARRLAGGRTLRLRGRAIAVRIPIAQPGLNRNVRALRSALAQLARVPVAYFGRDHLVSGGAALAWVGEEEDTLEAILGAEAPEAELVRYPVHGDARVRGVRFTPFVPSADELAAALGGTVVPPFPSLPVEDPDAGFVSSGVADVPIGFVEALVRHDGARVIAARLRGDFQAPARGLAALEVALAGVALEPTALRTAIAGALPVLVGVVDAGVFADAVLESRAGALAALASKYRTLAALRSERDKYDKQSGLNVSLARPPLRVPDRRDALRAVAGRHPGALRELDALSTAALEARAAAVDAALAAGRPVEEPWIRVALDYHQTLAAALARPRPRGRLNDQVLAELEARHGLERAELLRLLFG